MKTLDDHIILYDAECPLCQAYTKAFVKSGMLPGDGRVEFEKHIDEFKNVNAERAKDEIALLDTRNNTVHYGVDSLVAILGYNLPVITRIMKVRPVRWAIGKLYKFISFNRKVIAPGRKFEAVNSCTPSMNLKYRWAYIVFAWMVTSFILVKFSSLLTGLLTPSDFRREFLICGGQVVFQGLISFTMNRKRVIHYLGNMMTVSMIGALLLLPMFLIASWIQTPWVALIYFFTVVAFMLYEHSRRVKILELPWTLSLTWVVYRFLILLVIL